MLPTLDVLAPDTNFISSLDPPLFGYLEWTLGRNRFRILRFRILRGVQIKTPYSRA